ncbi:hypothetical protein AC579_5774 [Pseudocercospora musae]|uniref:Protein kinase domain-containing protein n=1 Tax=Pseudocercospora musae TaxID=113226 RepID=A0A139GT46_9PEZI|nr:hypothetical protein AC579_5774 [Pseudocercospora musae]
MNPAQGWEIVSGGATARVDRQLRSTQVVKLQYPDCFDPDLTRCELQREFDIYQILPKHPRLLQLCPGSTPQRLILPYLPNGTLQDRLENHEAPLNDEQRALLGTDAAEAVAVLHENQVVHGDLQPRNFMLTDENRLCLIDFAGSTLRNDKGTAIESVRYFLPRPIEDLPSVRTDLFALGSVLYAIFSGRAPYADKSDEEVVRLFGARQFPSTDDILCGNEVRGCWTGSYCSAKQIFEDLTAYCAELQDQN